MVGCSYFVFMTPVAPITCMRGLSGEGSLITVNGMNLSAASASPPITTFGCDGRREGGGEVRYQRVSVIRYQGSM